MNAEGKSFSDFVNDKDGDYATAQFLSLTNQLIEQGRDPKRVFRSLYWAGTQASIGHSIGAYADFIFTAQEHAESAYDDLKELLEKHDSNPVEH